MKQQHEAPTRHAVLATTRHLLFSLWRPLHGHLWTGETSPSWHKQWQQSFSPSLLIWSKTISRRLDPPATDNNNSDALWRAHQLSCTHDMTCRCSIETTRRAIMNQSDYCRSLYHPIHHKPHFYFIALSDTERYEPNDAHSTLLLGVQC